MSMPDETPLPDDDDELILDPFGEPDSYDQGEADDD